MRVSVRHIQEAIAADFDVELGLIRSSVRTRDVAWARQYAMALARELTELSLPSLGRIFERDHTTILTGIRQAERRIANNRTLALKLEARKLLLECEPQKVVDVTFIGFPPKSATDQDINPQDFHRRSTNDPLASDSAMAA